MKEKNKERRKIEGEIYNSPVQPIMNWIYLFSTFIHENRKGKHKLTNFTHIAFKTFSANHNKINKNRAVIILNCNLLLIVK